MNRADLDAVNDEVNALPYKADAQRYGQLDLGWPVALLRLATCYVETGEDHSVLIVSADDGDYMLDNRQPRPVPMGEVAALGYRPHRMQASGGARSWVEWRLT